MLEPIEVLPGARKALRRAGSIECEILSDLWDVPLPFHATDVSPYGMWINTHYPLEVGEELLVSFRPPGPWLHHDVVVLAEVKRTALGRRKGDRHKPGMGIAFEPLGDLHWEIDRALRGLPPPLPTRPMRRRVERLWVDLLLN